MAYRPGRSWDFQVPPDPGAVGTFEWTPDLGGAGSFKRLPDETVTKEVTVGKWPKPSADKKKCVTSSTNLNQFNFFESNYASKPPPAASKHSDPDAAFAYFGNPQTRAKSGPPRDLQTQARSGPWSGRQTREQSGPSSGLLTRAGLPRGVISPRAR